MTAIWIFLIGLGLVAVLLLGRPLLLILKGIVSGQGLMFAVRKTDGTASGKCPKCRSPVSLTEIREGKQAFTCAHCGEEGTWL